jgi:predicted transcriptional regulator
MSDARNVIRVGDVMSTHFVLVDGRITVADALAELRAGQVKALLVDKRHADDEYGIVLLSDIARRVLAKDRAPERVNVYEIMSKPVLSVRSAMDIRYCARLFDKFGLTLAPVIDDGSVVGVITYDDMVLRGLARDEPR